MLSLCVLLLLNIVRATIADDAVVKISQGTIYGTLSGDGSYEKYQGIPYAEPPTGNKRYKAPVTPAKWTGTFYANRTNIQCPQINSWTGGVDGTEDCLILNVYRQKASNVTAKQSVMVFVHGGGLNSGASGPYDADFLMKHGVVLVTINYRLGSLGFLCYKTKDIPGNAGLKDQIAAFRWVKQNIHAFGGDPDSITIFGESAGALSVDLQTLSHSSEKLLFNRAIAESGSALAEWAIDRKPFDRVINVAKMLGADTSDRSKLTEFYQNVDYVKLIQTSVQYDSATNQLVPSYVCIEKSLATTEPFLTDYPANLIQSDCRREFDMITGFNNAEGILALLFKNPDDVNKLIQNFTKSLPRDLCFNSNKTQAEVAKIVKQFYFADGPYTNESVTQTIDYYTDILFMISTVRAQVARMDHSNISSFLYEFSYEGQRNLKYLFGSSLPGASHGDEVAYLFPLESLPFASPPSANDQIMIDRMTTMWTNFAKVGNPTPEVNTLLPVKWTPVSSDALNTFIINLNMTMHIRPLRQRIAFWDVIYKNYGCERKLY